MNITLITEDIRGAKVAEALSAGYLFVSEKASFLIDSGEAWTAVLRRIGGKALALHLLEVQPIPAAEAVKWGLADALVPASEDPVEWVDAWLRNRSEVALQSAASLVAHRGGDPAERAEFARLFAAGEPQRGLKAFLEKQKPDWRRRELKDEG